MLTRRSGIAILVAAVSLMAAAQGVAMAKMVLFSALQGKVLLAGKPVAGATVEREFVWGWKDETGRDSAITDGGGGFSLPPVVRNSVLGALLPHEPSIRQTILIKHGGQTYKAWMFDKGNYDDNGELSGKPIVMTCRLETTPQRRGSVYGICELS